MEFKFSKGHFYPVLVMDKIFSHRNRHRILKFLRLILILLGIFLITGAFTSQIDFLSQYIDIISFIFPKITGLFLISLSVVIVVFLWESFFRSHYLKKKDEMTFKDTNNIADFLGFEASQLVYDALKWKRNFNSIDLLKSFFDSEIGKMAMIRAGISKESIKEFRKNINEENAHDYNDIFKEALDIIKEDNRKIITCQDLIIALFRKEKIFSEMLFKFEIKEMELGEIFKWVMRYIERRKRKEAWWSKENLGHIKSFGKDWAYGETYTLDKYGNDLVFQSAEISSLRLIGKSEQIKQMEIILSRREESNVLIVGEPGVGRKTIILGFSKMISRGEITPVLEFKRMFQLDTDAIVAATKHKGEFEELLIKIFNEAVAAGNIILVIENFPSFLRSAASLGTNLTSFLEPYFNSPSLQIMAVSDLTGFHQVIEPDSSLMKFFDRIDLKELDDDESIIVLEEVAEKAESESGIIFTYKAIEEIIRSSRQYLTEGAMPEKAIDLLAQLVPFVIEKKKILVQKEDVTELVRLRTSIPVGKINPEEKEKLLNLESILHKRIVGQEEAVSAISEAMRRARVEIRDTKKPIGSFLFLGPTGVGKTETAKSLAEVFFGTEENIIRFDMSEYQTDEAIERLIGSFKDNKPGILSSRLRDKPYGLLLMDEFEKTNSNTLNLFLQILDEGFFSDAFGKRINMRNIILIATSNAGANLIWDFVKKGVNPVEMREEIIDKLRGNGIFKPELLNRFDGIIIFHPLNDEHLKKIAGLMLNKLKKRLKEKDIDLIINDALIEITAKLGSDPVFGARPMQRVIQEKIEHYIAKKMISGEIKRGSKVEFKEEELRNIQ